MCGLCSKVMVKELSFPSTLSAGYNIIITTLFTLKLWVLISSETKILFLFLIPEKWSITNALRALSVFLDAFFGFSNWYNNSLSMDLAIPEDIWRRLNSFFYSCLSRVFPLIKPLFRLFGYLTFLFLLCFQNPSYFFSDSWSLGHIFCTHFILPCGLSSHFLRVDSFNVTNILLLSLLHGFYHWC